MTMPLLFSTTTSPLLPPPHVSLQTSKEDLLQADFEGALKFFRVQLPKRYRAAENARRLMEQACNIKVRTSPNKHMQSRYLNLNIPYFHPLLNFSLIQSNHEKNSLLMR